MTENSNDAPATAAPTPRPTPGPRPGPPKPGPRPAAPAPPANRPATPPAKEPAPISADAKEIADQVRDFGRVEQDGTVYVRTADGERPVGSYPGADPDEALAYFGRKYLDLRAQVLLAEQRLELPDPPVKDVARALDALRPQLVDANVVGDLADLDRRMEALDGRLTEARAAAEAQRAKAKEEARLAREELVAKAEQISQADPARQQWKQAGDTMRELFDAWKAAQRNGPRLDKSVEEELWRRFSHARTVFDRHRRQYFSELDKQQSEVKTAKQRLIDKAKELSASTDWAATTAAYRDLMNQWKAAGRASRKDDDALWEQFRAAQQVFFDARNADQAKVDEEFSANLVVKEELLVQAEALLPISDLEAAKKALREIGERWEAAGKVPRADVPRVERRLRAVEKAVRDAEDEQWRRSNPETKARAEGMLGQLQDSIASLEADLESAHQTGNANKVSEIEEALATKKQWLEMVQATASER